MRVRSLLRAAWVEYERDRARYLAVAMVYYALVSLVPLLLLLLSALGLLLRFSASAVEAEQQVLLAVEANFGAELRGAIERALGLLQEQSIAATAVSLAGLVLTASVLFRQLRVGFRAIWGLDPPLIAGSLRAAMRATLVERIVAFAMVLGGGVLLMVAIVLITVSSGSIAGSARCRSLERRPAGCRPRGPRCCSPRSRSPCFSRCCRRCE